jgi:hypothetical protein
MADSKREICDAPYADNKANDRHNNTVSESSYYFAKSAANYNSYGKVNDIAFHGKFFKFFKHSHNDQFLVMKQYVEGIDFCKRTFPGSLFF